MTYTLHLDGPAGPWTVPHEFQTWKAARYLAMVALKPRPGAPAAWDRYEIRSR